MSLSRRSSSSSSHSSVCSGASLYTSSFLDYGLDFRPTVPDTSCPAPALLFHGGYLEVVSSNKLKSRSRVVSLRPTPRIDDREREKRRNAVFFGGEDNTTPTVWNDGESSISGDASSMNTNGLLTPSEISYDSLAPKRYRQDTISIYTDREPSLSSLDWRAGKNRETLNHIVLSQHQLERRYPNYSSASASVDSHARSDKTHGSESSRAPSSFAPSPDSTEQNKTMLEVSPTSQSRIRPGISESDLRRHSPPDRVLQQSKSTSYFGSHLKDGYKPPSLLLAKPIKPNRYLQMAEAKGVHAHISPPLPNDSNGWTGHRSGRPVTRIKTVGLEGGRGGHSYASSGEDTPWTAKAQGGVLPPFPSATTTSMPSTLRNEEDEHTLKGNPFINTHRYHYTKPTRANSTDEDRSSNSSTISIDRKAPFKYSEDAHAGPSTASLDGSFWKKTNEPRKRASRMALFGKALLGITGASEHALAGFSHQRKC